MAPPWLLELRSPPCSWGAEGEAAWRTPELCCPVDVPPPLAVRCWGRTMEAAAAEVSRCCGDPSRWARPQLTLPRAYAQSGGRHVSRWCRGRGVRRACCGTLRHGAGGNPGCWDHPRGITFAVCCLAPSGLPLPGGAAATAARHPPDEDAEWTRGLQFLASAAPPLVEWEVLLWSQGCWSDWTSYLRCCGPSWDDAYGPVQRGHPLCMGHGLSADCCEDRRVALDLSAPLRGSPALHLAPAAIALLGHGPGGPAEAAVPVVQLGTHRLFAGIQRLVGVVKVAPWWLLVPGVWDGVAVDTAGLLALVRELGDGEAVPRAFASCDAPAAASAEAVLRRWRRASVGAVRRCPRLFLAAAARGYFSLRDGILVSQRLVLEVAKFSLAAPPLRRNLCTDTNFPNRAAQAYSFSCCVEVLLNVTVQRLEGAFGATTHSGAAPRRASGRAGRPVTQRVCPEPAARSPADPLSLLFLLSADASVEEDCLGATASWGAREKLWALAPEPLPRCVAAGVPVVLLDTRPFVYFSDGRSLHQPRPAVALAEAFAGEGPVHGNATWGPEQDSARAALRADALLADWVVGFDSDTAYDPGALREVLSRFPEPRSRPYIVGHVVDMWHQAFPDGGAGMALSRKAAEVLGAAFRAGICPIISSSDGAFGFCAALLGVPMADAPGFLREDASRIPRALLESLAPRLVSSNHDGGPAGHERQAALIREASRCAPPS